MTTEEIEKLEISKELANIAIKKGEALKRLLANPDYIEIISEGFFKSYPTELGLAIANNTGAYNPEHLLKTLGSINVLKGYEFQVATNYTAGLQDIEDINQYIAESVNNTEDGE